MKNLLLPLFLLLLLFTITSCNNEPKVVPMSNEERSVIDSIFTDFEKEKEKEALLAEEEKTELQELLDSNNYSFSYRNTTVMDENNSPIATFVIDDTTSTITVNINNASYSDIKELKGTIKYKYSNTSRTLFTSSDLINIDISYKNASNSELIEVKETDDETFSFMDLKEYLYDIYLQQLISEGFVVENDFATITLKGKINSDLNSTNFDLSPISVNIKKPLPINDKLYSGKVEMKLYISSSKDSSNIDANADFNLIINSKKETTTISGKVRLSLTISTEESITFDYKYSLESFSINNKAINTKEVEEYIKNKISLLSEKVD